MKSARDYTVEIPCRWEDAEGEPCERTVTCTLGDGGVVEDAVFSCAHESAIVEDPEAAAKMQEEAMAAYTCKMEWLHDAHVDAQIDRAHDRAMGWS
jgi:hypothetical protein